MESPGSLRVDPDRSMTPLLSLRDRAAAHIEQLYTRFRLPPMAAEAAPVADPPYGLLEHLLHELSHAAHLRIDPLVPPPLKLDPLAAMLSGLEEAPSPWAAVKFSYGRSSNQSNLDSRVSARIARASLLSPSKVGGTGEHLEAMAWGVEFRCWELLGLVGLDCFSCGEAHDHAAIQGVEAAEFDRAVRRKSARRHARTVVRWIEEALDGRR